MTTYTTNLGLALPVTGDLTGTWGDTVNNAITSLLDSAVAGTTTLSSDADVTLTDTTGAANQARQAIILWTAGGTVTRNITAPARTKAYVVINATSSTQSIVLRGTGPTTGVTVVAGERCLVAWNGTDFVKVGSTVFSGTLGVANGGTGATSLTLNNVLLGNGTSAVQVVAPGANGNVLTSDGTTWLSTPLPTGPGLSANNAFTGANTFYNTTGQTFGTATATQDGFVIGGRAGGSSTYRITFTPGTLTANRTLTFPDATDTVAVLGAAQTFTGQQNFAGSASTLAVVLSDAAEVATVSATAATGTINYDLTTQSVLYYTSNASANWTTNFRASSGTSLNTALATGQSITAAFLVTQGATAYYNNVVQVDGTTSGVTTRWIGGAPTAGNASGIDSYRYLIIKTGSATFTVLASVNQFKA
jgi:hypothetical protein